MIPTSQTPNIIYHSGNIQSIEPQFPPPDRRPHGHLRPTPVQPGLLVHHPKQVATSNCTSWSHTSLGMRPVMSAASPQSATVASNQLPSSISSEVNRHECPHGFTQQSPEQSTYFPHQGQTAEIYPACRTPLHSISATDSTRLPAPESVSGHILPNTSTRTGKQVNQVKMLPSIMPSSMISTSKQLAAAPAIGQDFNSALASYDTDLTYQAHSHQPGNSHSALCYAPNTHPLLHTETANPPDLPISINPYGPPDQYLQMPVPTANHCFFFNSHPYGQPEYPPALDSLQDIDNPECLIRLLKQLNYRHVSGKILSFIRNIGKGLGFFHLSIYPRIPIKFEFQVDKKHHDLLTQSNPKSYVIEGHLNFNTKDVIDYIYRHPPGSFRHLLSQNMPAHSIPISLEPSAITKKGTNIKILTYELQGAIDYLNTLGESKVIAEVVHWRDNGFNCKAIHKVEEKGLCIKFLFDIPKEYRESGKSVNCKRFKKIQCSLSFDKNSLTDYVSAIGIKKLRNDFRISSIAIRGSHIRFIQS